MIPSHHLLNLRRSRKYTPLGTAASWKRWPFRDSRMADEPRDRDIRLDSYRKDRVARLRGGGWRSTQRFERGISKVQLPYERRIRKLVRCCFQHCTYCSVLTANRADHMDFSHAPAV
jgi:hypothetical protein